VVSRVVLQDFTGVPLLADLAAMRNVAAKQGKNPKISNHWFQLIWSWITLYKSIISAKRKRWT
jgi:aconitase A